MLSASAAGARLLRARRPVTSKGIVVRASSTRMGASSMSTSDQQHEQWKQVYREFILQVHPDFFQDSPRERSVNEKSLKTFSQHLERLQLGHGHGHASPLVFFVKQGGGAHHGDAEDSSKPRHDGDLGGGPSPKKFLLPLEAHHEMAAHLLKAGITSVLPLLPPEPETPRRQASAHNHRRADDANNDNNTSSGWHSWGDDLFGGTAANRAWDQAAAAAAAAGGGGRARGRSAFTSVPDNTREGRQRTTQWGAAFERAGGDGDESSASRLGQVLASDAGRALVRERRASSRRVRELVDELRGQYGFGEFTFRCGWSKSNLCVALGSLLETCHAHRGTLNVPDFGGLEVAFRNDPSALDKEEIRLCPADVPNQWMAVLQGVTPAVLSRAQESSRDLVSLQERASGALRGTRISRGLSCSKARYREFLGRLCAEEDGADMADVDGDGDGNETGTDVSLGDWSGLRCRVEEGFSRVSKVLEDGTIQVGSEMSLETLRQCLRRDLASSSAASAKNLRLAESAAATSSECRRLLGLQAVGRARRAVTLPQMISACEALVRLGETADRGSLGAEAVAARRRLRGHSVRIVGSRVGVCDGVSDDGEILVAWNWAGEEGHRSGAGGDGLLSSSPFS